MLVGGLATMACAGNGSEGEFPCAAASCLRPAEATDDTCPPAPESATDIYTCQTPPPRLKSYDAIVPGSSFSLPVVQDGSGAWVPAERLSMPQHHSSTIVWRDRDHQLDSLRDERVLVIALGLGRTSIDHDPNRGYWFATYGAEVMNVCSCKPKR